jgi:hypothetical protein
MEFRGQLRSLELDGRPLPEVKGMPREAPPRPGACELTPCLNGGRCVESSSAWGSAATCDCSTSAFQGRLSPKLFNKRDNATRFFYPVFFIKQLLMVPL